MTSFDARLRMAGQTGIPLGVEVDLTGERMTLTAAGAEVADWSLGEIDIRSRPDGFHIYAEGEKVILNVTDRIRFASAVGL